MAMSEGDALVKAFTRLDVIYYAIVEQLGHRSFYVNHDVSGKLHPSRAYKTGGFIISAAGHIGKLVGPRMDSVYDIQNWANHNTPYTAVVTRKGDIIAYVSEPRDFDLIRDICDSTPLPWEIPPPLPWENLLPLLD